MHLCHICLLPIPETIVSPTHPLFGTKDHVIPKSGGGTNAKANLAPAHYYCNQKKGDKSVTHQLMLHCFSQIHRELTKHGMAPKTPTPRHFTHLHAMIEYLCREIDLKEDEIEELYRERGFCR